MASKEILKNYEYINEYIKFFPNRQVPEKDWKEKGWNLEWACRCYSYGNTLASRRLICARSMMFVNGQWNTELLKMQLNTTVPEEKLFLKLVATLVCNDINILTLEE